MVVANNKIDETKNAGRGCTPGFFPRETKKESFGSTCERKIRRAGRATSHFYSGLKIAKAIQHPLYLNRPPWYCYCHLHGQARSFGDAVTQGADLRMRLRHQKRVLATPGRDKTTTNHPKLPAGTMANLLLPSAELTSRYEWGTSTANQGRPSFPEDPRTRGLRHIPQAGLAGICTRQFVIIAWQRKKIQRRSAVQTTLLHLVFLSKGAAASAMLLRLPQQAFCVRGARGGSKKRFLLNSIYFIFSIFISSHPPPPSRTLPPLSTEQTFQNQHSRWFQWRGMRI